MPKVKNWSWKYNCDNLSQSQCQKSEIDVANLIEKNVTQDFHSDFIGTKSKQLTSAYEELW